MFQLIYCSIARQKLEDSDIQLLLNTSQKFNASNQVTGCLLYYNKEFVQILEGEETVVKQLFKKITTDIRHSNVFLMAEDEAPERMFNNWTMAYRKIDDTAPESKLFLKEQNLLALSEFAEKPTLSVKLFFTLTKTILDEEINRQQGGNAKYPGR